MPTNTSNAVTSSARNHPQLINLLDAVDSIARQTMLLAINEAVKTTQAELAGHDLTIAAEPAGIR